MNETPATAAPATAPTGPAPAAVIADPTEAHLVKEWVYEPSPLIACRFDPSGRYVFAGAQDSRVVRLHLESGEFTPFPGHESWVRAIGFSPDGARCWTGGYDGRLIAWEAAATSPAPIVTQEAHQGWIRSLAVSPDGKWVATAGNDHLVKIWETGGGSLVHTLTGHDRHVYCVHFTPDSQTLFSGDLRGVLKIWNANTGAQSASWEAAQLFTPNPGQGAEYGGIRTMAYVPEANHLICGGLHNGSNPFGAVQEPLVVVVDCATGQTVRIHTGKDAPKAICWRVIWHPQGFLCGGCGGSAGGFVSFWKPDAETDFHRYGLGNILLDLDASPDGLHLVSAHHNHHLCLSKLAKG